MEKKLKFSEFAELIGVTAKTVYKMKDREEIKTVIERVNGREIQLVVTNTEEIEKFRSMNGKGMDNNGVCEDMLTDNETKMNNNNSSQSNNNTLDANEFLNKIYELNERYLTKLDEVKNQVVDGKVSQRFLEDKQAKEGLYLEEIKNLENDKLALEKDSVRLVTENKQLLSERELLLTEKEQLVKNNKNILLLSLTSIVILLLVLVGLVTFNIGQKKVNESDIQKKEQIQQVNVQEVQKPAESDSKSVPTKRRK